MQTDARFCALNVFSLLVTLTALSGAYADETAATSAPTSALSTRDQLYAQLSADVAELEQRGSILKRVVKLVRPAVVHIEARRETDATRTPRGDAEEAGSGVIIERRGKLYVLTNRHVIKYSTLTGINVKLADGRVVHPKQTWADPATDVAIMAITTEGLLPARLGDSSKLEIGDFVLAVGSPFGLSHSVTYGIISAKGRRDLRLGDDGVQLQDFLQTDAAINPGNSGGPLLSLRGEVIGLTTAIASTSGANEGIGFAIPINMVMVIADQLIERGMVVRAFLGVKLDSTFGPTEAAQLGMARPEGARVSGITRNSPAEQARILVGDVILEFDGIRVEDDMHLINLVSLTPVQKEVEVRLLREGRPLGLRLRVANRAQMPAD
ncbi:MAG TPA: trypsin-like peptidase domain-containing protein [Pirellulaceae bacterium]|nr:trypsin-like peptidase domain-containing protein [Pirellulaceae bacterium]